MPKETITGVFAWLISQGVILAILAFVGRSFVENWLSAKFGNKTIEFESKLAETIGKKDKILSALIAQNSYRETTHTSEKIAAIKGLAESINGYARYSGAPKTLESIKLDEIEKNKRDAVDHSLKEFFETIAKTCNIDRESLSHIPKNPRVHSIFISDRSWKLYQAYSGLVATSVMIISMYSFGLKGMVKIETLHEPIVDLFPNTKDHFEEYGPTAAFGWANFLYEQFYQQIKSEVNDKASGSLSQKSLSEILQEVDEAADKDQSLEIGQE